MRYACRIFVKSPGFTAIALLTLALGIGANTAVFSVVNTVLIRPLPYDNPQQIVTLWEQRPRENAFQVQVSAPDFLDWRRMAQSFSSLALYDAGQFNLTSGGDPERIHGARVTAGFFESLGVRPQMGRTFELGEEQAGRNQAVIVTYGLWQRRFGGDPALVGKPIGVNGAQFSVIGILPRDFRFPFASEADLFVPIVLTADERRYRGIHTFAGVARLKPGVTAQQAQSEMDLVSKQIERQNPESNTGHSARIIPLRENLSGKIKPALMVLLGAVFLVALIACANVANLLLARATVRRREMAIRAALGSSRWRLVRQSLTESALLAFGGAALGILVALWSLDALRSGFFSRIAFFSTTGLSTLSLDWRVLLFTLCAVILSTLFFGVSPALASADVDLNDALRTGGRGSTTGDRKYFRSALIVGQVALSLVLLTGAGLLAKSFIALLNVNPGFQPGRLVTATIALPRTQYRTTEQAAAFYDRLLERVRALPGVQSADVTDVLPLSGDDNRMGVDIEGYVPRPGERVRLNPREVSPGYLETMGVQLLAGRALTPADATATHPVAIVSQAAAKRFWPQSSPIGKYFKFSRDGVPSIEVVGVVASVHNRALDQDPTSDVYMPFRLNPYLFPPTEVTLVIRTTNSEMALGPAIRETVASLDPSLPVAGIRAMQTYVADSVAPKRFNLILLGAFALLALVLASAGLYGVMSYLVSQRTPEIGIRMALGATRHDVLRLVIGRGLGLAGIGVAIGLIVSLAGMRVMSGLLFGVEPRDPLVFAVVPLVLISVAALASFIPARRASHVDPLVALRMD